MTTFDVGGIPYGPAEVAGLREQLIERRDQILKDPPGRWASIVLLSHTLGILHHLGRHVWPLDPTVDIAPVAVQYLKLEDIVAAETEINSARELSTQMAAECPNLFPIFFAGMSPEQHMAELDVLVTDLADARRALT